MGKQKTCCQDLKRVIEDFSSFLDNESPPHSLSDKGRKLLALQKNDSIDSTPGRRIQVISGHAGEHKHGEQAVTQAGRKPDW